MSGKSNAIVTLISHAVITFNLDVFVSSKDKLKKR